MYIENESKKFIDDPQLIAMQLSDVAYSLGVSVNEARSVEKAAQLKEIIKAIERLQGLGVAIPESLICEKARLSEELEVSEDAAIALEPILRGLLDVIEKIVEKLPVKKNAISSKAIKGSFIRKRALHESRHDEAVAFVLSPRESRKLAGMNQQAFRREVSQTSISRLRRST